MSKKMKKNDEKVCQYCKKHSNRPSFCKEKQEYVPRKQKACKSFK